MLNLPTRSEKYVVRKETSAAMLNRVVEAVQARKVHQVLGTRSVRRRDVDTDGTPPTQVHSDLPNVQMKQQHNCTSTYGTKQQISGDEQSKPSRFVPIHKISGIRKVTATDTVNDRKETSKRNRLLRCPIEDIYFMWTFYFLFLLHRGGNILTAVRTFPPR